MTDQPRQRLVTLRKVQLFFVFVAIITGLIWLLNGPALNPGQRYFRMAVSGVAYVGVVVTTVLIMRKRSAK